ncbi:MAG: hypothetical protein M0Q91_17525, partial [Methanoregula sp.]|nr:hypothetical protein [Methanoregula sp.]
DLCAECESIMTKYLGNKCTGVRGAGQFLPQLKQWVSLHPDHDEELDFLACISCATAGEKDGK